MFSLESSMHRIIGLLQLQLIVGWLENNTERIEIYFEINTGKERWEINRTRIKFLEKINVMDMITIHKIYQGALTPHNSNAY